MTKPLPERAKEALEGSTPGPWEGRAVYVGLPVEPCEFGVISPSEGRETARIWNLEDARLIALTPDLARAVVAAEELYQAIVIMPNDHPALSYEEKDRIKVALSSYRKTTGGGS